MAINKRTSTPNVSWLHYINYGIRMLENNKLFTGLLILVVNIG